MNYSNRSGKYHWNWKGGKKINSQGYILIYSPKHPHKDKQGYVREHRSVMEKYLNRILLPSEIVHHINKIKNDNRIVNLKLLQKIEHDRMSILNRPKRSFYKKCLICEKNFLVYPSTTRVVCCSKSCGAKLRCRKRKLLSNS